MPPSLSWRPLGGLARSGTTSTTPRHPHASRLLPRQPARGGCGRVAPGAAGLGWVVLGRGALLRATLKRPCHPSHPAPASQGLTLGNPTSHHLTSWGRVVPGGGKGRDSQPGGCELPVLAGLHRRACLGHNLAEVGPLPAVTPRAPLADPPSWLGRDGLSPRGAHARFTPRGLARTPRRNTHAHAGGLGYGGRCLQCVTST